jgi:hypothetical protein
MALYLSVSSATTNDLQSGDFVVWQDAAGKNTIGKIEESDSTVRDMQGEVLPVRVYLSTGAGLVGTNKTVYMPAGSLSKVEGEPEAVAAPGRVIDSVTATAITATEADAIDLRMGIPSEAQFAQLKSYLHADNNSTAEDWFVFSAIASDNLVSRSYRKWHLNTLTQMAEMLKGKPFELNHEWDDVCSVVGFIFESALLKLETPVMAAISQPMKTEFNQAIAESEGHHMLICSIAVPRSEEETVNAIESRKHQAVSTGGFLQQIKMICPNCSATHGRDVTFTERDKEDRYVCPHLIPSEYSYGMGEDDDDLYADYLILDGLFDGVELSSVVAGNLPYAQIVR